MRGTPGPAAVWEALEARCGSLVEQEGGGPADRAAWAGLLVWLTRESARCGAFSAHKSAVRLALLCRRLLDGGLQGPRRPGRGGPRLPRRAARHPRDGADA